MAASTLRIFVARLSAQGNAQSLSPLATELGAQAVFIDGALGAFKTATTEHQVKAAGEEVAQANFHRLICRRPIAPDQTDIFHAIFLL